MRVTGTDSARRLVLGVAANLCALLLFSLVLAHGSGATFEFGVSCGDDPCTASVEIVFIHAGTGERLGRTLVQPGVAGRVPGTVTDACSDNGLSLTDILVTVAGEDFVSSQPRLDEIIDSREVVRLWRASWLEAQILTADRDNPDLLSHEATLLFWPADGSGGILPVFQTNCPVENGSLGCKIPEGKWDIRLQMRGFAPVQWWAETFSNAAVRDLGPLEVQPGATVKGRLVVIDAEIPDLTEDATIEIAPTEIVRHFLPREKLRRLRVLRTTVKPQRDGSFGFQDLAVGSFLIRALVAGVGESELRKISVKEPVALNLSSPLVVSPRIEAVLRTGFALDQYGLPLEADLELLGAEIEADAATLSFALDPSGLTPIPPLIAGDYLLFIHSTDGVDYFRDVLKIDHNTTVIDVDIQQVPVFGTVVMDDEPLIGAHLEFSGREGERVPTSTDEDGGFSLILPSEGQWLVSISAERPRVPRAFAEVDVVTGSPVVIEVEKTGLRVTVKDATLVPVPSAMVTVISAGPYNLSMYTDEEGVIEVIGLPSSEYLVQAFHEMSQSLLKIIEVEETQVVDLVLPLETTASVVRGKMIDHDGRAVGHAAGAIYPRDAGGDPVTLRPPEITCDEEGRFTALLPSNAVFFSVAVAVDGYDIFVSNDGVVTGDAGETTTLVLSESSGGILEVVLPKADSGSAYTFLVINGTPVPTGWIRNGPSVLDSRIGEDGRVVFIATDMPAGAYKLCRADFLGYLRAISGSEGTNMECVEGFLAYGSRLRLEGFE